MVLYVYYGGHGVSHGGKHIACLNSSEANKALYHLQYKLSLLAQDVAATIRIIAVYDCCSTDVSYTPRLLDEIVSRGVGDLKHPSEVVDLRVCSYFHFQMSRPGGIASANADNTLKFLLHLKKEQISTVVSLKQNKECFVFHMT